MSEQTHSARRLNNLANRLGAQTYLEIGVEKGLTFFDVEVPFKQAVDPEFRFDWRAHQTATMQFFPGFSDDFFADYTGESFDLIFLDGLHHVEQTLRDLMNALAWSHDRTVIVIDDVFPTDAFSGLREHADANKFRQLAGGVGEAWHGDVYKLVYYIHDFMPSLNYATIDDGWNRQTVVWKEARKNFKPLLNNLEQISRLTYFEIMKSQEIMKFCTEAEAVEAAISGINGFRTGGVKKGIMHSVVQRIKNAVKID